MVINERESRKEYLISVAKQMMTAARTAPKGKGFDIVEIALVAGDEEIQRLSALTRQKGEDTGLKFMLRDSENILQADVIVLIGTRTQVQGLN
ncbi:MAG: ferredoxin, partial [Bacteroidota bacterium]|nr:ferredoxin [Bacteroidota bacterium]